MDQSIEQEFELEHLTLRARVWGKGNHKKVLALHGWLDNCASFNFLANRLADVHLVALDMAGHGLSEHRNHMAPYNIWEDIVEIFAVANQLGWDDFSILGHSRGAIVATMAAGTFPERIAHLVLLDGIWPPPAEQGSAPKQLAHSIGKMLGPNRKQPTVYTSFESAISARMNSSWPITKEASEALAERGVKAVDGGFIWCADPKLQLPSAIKLTADQIESFTRETTAKILLIVAEEGIFARAPEILDQVKEYSNIDVVHKPGGHHFHMDESIDGIARLVNEFID